MLSFLRCLFQWEPAHDPNHVDETVNIPVMQNQRVRYPLRNGEYRECVVRRVYAVHYTSDNAVMGKTRMMTEIGMCRTCRPTPAGHIKMSTTNTAQRR